MRKFSEITFIIFVQSINGFPSTILFEQTITNSINWKHKHSYLSSDIYFQKAQNNILFSFCYSTILRVNTEIIIHKSVTHYPEYNFPVTVFLMDIYSTILAAYKILIETNIGSKKESKETTRPIIYWNMFIIHNKKGS